LKEEIEGFVCHCY